MKKIPESSDLYTIQDYDIQKVDTDEWNDLLSRSAICDAFQTYEWALVLRNSMNVKPTFLVVRHRSKMIGGVIILKKKFFGMFDSYEIRGGPLYVGENRTIVMKRIVETLKERTGKAIYSLFIPFPAINHAFLNIFLNEGYHPFPFRTIIIDLRKPLDLIWSALDKKARWGVRKAERMGLRAKVADTWQEWEEYYHLHTLHSREKQYPARPLNFFEEMFKLHDKDMSRLFLAESGKKLVAGSLFLVYNSNMIFLQNAWLDSFRKYNPNNLIQWKSIEWAKENGVEAYDINGLPPEEIKYLHGIYDYKKRWDGQIHWFYYYVNRRSLYAGMRLIRSNQLAWKIFSRFRSYGAV